MNRVLKIVVLGVGLVLPVLIFLFLRVFGENRFDIPIYYQTQEEILYPECDGITAPYSIDLGSFISGQHNQKAFVFSGLFDDLSEQESYQILRLNERLDDLYVQYFLAEKGTLIYPKEVNVIHIKNLDNVWKCVFQASKKNHWILVDRKGQIRGYYEVNEEEIDRLIVEMKILLENDL